jgi:hypothetical protein
MTIRWRATVYYRTAHGIVDVVHEVSEISDVHDLVERGPHWDTVAKIEIIRINHVTGANLTVEQAEKL